jgi:hypothetical protein
VQLFAAHAQFVPAMDTRVNPVGIVSVTVTVPLVRPPVWPFETFTMYCAFCWPWVKLPVCDFAMARSGGPMGLIVAESLALFGAEPPPERVTVFVSGDGVFTPTFTRTVIGG